MRALFVGLLIPLFIGQSANANCNKSMKLKELPIDKKIVSIILKKDITVGAFYRGVFVNNIALVLREGKDKPQPLKAGRKVRLYKVDYSFLYAYDHRFEFFAFHAGRGRAEWIKDQTINDFELASNHKLQVICENF